MRALSFTEVASSGRLADWIDPHGGPCLRWEPYGGGTLWSRPTPTSDEWRRFSGRPPASGWRHIEQPCCCPYCCGTASASDEPSR